MPQLKRNLISRTINLVYELPHELQNDLRLRISGNKETLKNSQIWMETKPSAQPPFKKSNFGKSSKKKKKKKHAKVHIKFSCPVQFYWTFLSCSDYFVLDCLSKQMFCHNLVQSSSYFNFLTISAT